VQLIMQPTKYIIVESQVHFEINVYMFRRHGHNWRKHIRYYWKEFEANILLYHNQTERSYRDVHVKMLIYYIYQQMRSVLTVTSVF